MTAATHGVVPDADPTAWRQHRFGLSRERWERLAGRIVWVTGAGTGYGQAISLALAAAGATVMLTGRRLHKLEETVAAAAPLGIERSRFVTVPADITDPVQVAVAAKAITARGGVPYGLVNNAALPQCPAGRWPLMDMTAEQWRQQMATNVTGPWLTTRAVAPAMAAAGTARVLFLSSEAGWAFSAGHGAYNVSKAALNSLSGCWAAELAARFPQADVQVNVLNPGEARTEMNQGSTVSPFALASMALVLLSHPPGGPNGRYFHRDGRHYGFAHAPAYDRPLI
ncbi:MAG TPA: SDR family oxidoreductase [Azospirillum sp.]